MIDIVLSSNFLHISETRQVGFRFKLGNLFCFILLEKIVFKFIFQLVQLLEILVSQRIVTLHFFDRLLSKVILFHFLRQSFVVSESPVDVIPLTSHVPGHSAKLLKIRII